MCRAITEGGRRCPHDARKVELARRNRAYSRKTHRQVVTRLKGYGMDETASAVAALTPNKLPVFLLAAESTIPGILNDVRGSRRLPGVHNMITEDVRDRTSPEGKDLNALKFDPMAVESVQSALYELDKYAVEGGSDDWSRVSRLRTGLDVRKRALDAGIFSHADPATLTDEQRAEREWFYQNTSSADLSALTEVQQRVSDQFYRNHLESMKPRTRQRRPSDELVAAERANKGMTTVSELLKGRDEVDLGDGVVLTRNGAGSNVVKVEGMILPIDGDERASDVLRRIPKVSDLGITDDSALLGQTLVSHKYLSPDNPVGRNHIAALKREVIRRTLAGGSTPSDGDTGITEGKRSWFTTDAAASIGAKGDYSIAPRTEGFLLGKHLKAKRDAMNEVAERGRQRFGIPEGLGTSTTWTGNSKPKLGNYSGPVPTEERDAAQRHGWMLRSPKTVGQVGNVSDQIPEKVFHQAAAATRIVPEWEKALDPRHRPVVREQIESPVSEELRSRPADVLVGQANLVARNGRNPESVPTDSLVAKSILDTAFAQRDMFARHTPTASTAFASVPKGEDPVTWLNKVFVKDAAVSTNGYTITSPPDTPTPPSARPGTYRTRYLSGDGIKVSDSQTILGHRETFRVHHVGDEDGMPTVYLVSENAIVDERSAA